jgi:hypothetical protein
VSDEYRYRCAHGHEWVSVPVDKMRCPACGTITLRRIQAPTDLRADELVRAVEAYWPNSQPPSSIQAAIRNLREDA